MPSLDTYRKHAKQLVRWHRDRNYSVGEKVRLLERYRHLTDAEVLQMALPLTLAQEIIAVEAGHRDWAALKAVARDTAKRPNIDTSAPALTAAVPILFVRDVEAASAFFEQKLGFEVDFLHGNPPFYGSVSRDEARLHLRFVHEPNFAELAAREEDLILALIEVGNAKALFQEYESRHVDFTQTLVRQPWGGLEFHVRDPDGNVIAFVQFRRPARRTVSEEARVDQQVVPMIHVPDVDVVKTVDWYVSIGFTVLDTVDDGDGVNWALLAYGNSRLMVTGGGRSTTDDRRDVDLYIHADDVEGLFHQLKDRVEIRLGLQDTFYGAREFIVRDPNRYWVTFGQDLGDGAND